jgi:hypothetical protein
MSLFEVGKVFEIVIQMTELKAPQLPGKEISCFLTLSKNQ